MFCQDIPLKVFVRSKDVMEAIEMIKYEKPHEETKQNKHETSPMHWTDLFGEGQKRTKSICDQRQLKQKVLD